MSATMLALIGTLGVMLSGAVTAVVTWATTAGSRRAERHRDALAERDGLIERLERRLNSVEEALARAESRITVLEQERDEDRTLLDSARAHIARLEGMIPPPPPPRPTGL